MIETENYLDIFRYVVWFLGKVVGTFFWFLELISFDVSSRKKIFDAYVLFFVLHMIRGD